MIHFGIMVCMVVVPVAAELDAVQERIAGRFGRAEPRTRVREYVSGLVAGLERKNGWTLAERAGEVSPDRSMAAWARALAAGPPVPARPHRNRLLRLLRPPPVQMT
jgi:hypothetical protein